MIGALKQFAACGSSGFFDSVVFPPWHKYLGDNGNPGAECSVVVELPGDIWLIAAAILELLLRVAGIIAIVYFLIGAYTLMTSSGNPDNVKKGNGSMLKSMYGLAITMLATVTVNFLAGQFDRIDSSDPSFNPNDPLPQLASDSGGFVEDALTIAFQLIGVISILMIAIGAYKYVASGGDPQNMATAKKTITYALIGLFLALAVGFIVSFVVGRAT